MFLHENKQTFNELVTKTAQHFRLSEAIIEKDYFVSLILKELNKRIPDLIFKGGTSLSKCFKVIKRFSEDVDLSMVSITLGQRRKLKHEVCAVCEQLNFNINNLDAILSYKRFNRYLINYPKYRNDINIVPLLILETTFITKAYPVIDAKVSNYIYEFLVNQNTQKLVIQYDLAPFLIKTQTLERTFIDKVFALCDYYIKRVVDRSSRHLYDLYFLYSNIQIDDKFAQLIKDVYNERYLIDTCLSAKNDININSILEGIIKTEFFKTDYLTLTNNIATERLDYDRAISILKTIIQLNIFDFH